MFRRDFLIGAGLLSAGCASGCSSPRASEIDLPEPVQINQEEKPVADGMIGIAGFSARVLVLSRRDYPLGKADPLSAVSPTDLAVAWGPAALGDVRDRVELWQVNRRYVWRARVSDMKRPGVKDFTRHSGNWHMIPSDDEVAKQLRRVAKGDVVRIEGDLVSVRFDNGVYFRSSTRRDDTGDGACEIIRARSIVVERA